MKLNGSNVSDEFAIRADGRYEGELDGLRLGGNVISATAPGADSDQVAIRNHPNGGPVFSGPQVQPWVCQDGADGRPVQRSPATYDVPVQVVGRRRAVRSLRPEQPARRTSPRRPRRPGKTVPFIVRIETGYQDRDQYKIAVLYQPGQAVDGLGAAAAVQPQAADHPRRELRDRPPERGTRRASRATRWRSAAAGTSSPTTALGCGFAVMSTALDNAGHNCNIVTAGRVAGDGQGAPDRAATATLRYTIGTGCSGGSLVQQQVANAYPGIYQGILPQCSFPDAWSTGQQLADYHLIRGYFEDPTKWGTGVAWTPTQIARGRGPPQPRQLDRLRHGLLDRRSAYPTDGCPGVAGCRRLQRRRPTRRRALHARRLHDQRLRPAARRACGAPAEQADRPRLRRPAARQRRRPVRARGAREGRRSRPAQFVDLNAKIGGADIDINPTAERIDADRAGAAQRLPQRRRSTRPTT